MPEGSSGASSSGMTATAASLYSGRFDSDIRKLQPVRSYCSSRTSDSRPEHRLESGNPGSSSFAKANLRTVGQSFLALKGQAWTPSIGLFVRQDRIPVLRNLTIEQISRFR
jgi:hypothetical protein